MMAWVLDILGVRGEIEVTMREGGGYADHTYKPP